MRFDIGDIVIVRGAVLKIMGFDEDNYCVIYLKPPALAIHTGLTYRVLIRVLDKNADLAKDAAKILYEQIQTR